uniref:Uncharacterized protein n=1 Tax=Panagrolaimus sp. PS1159 TaxID=55785 RepID=A0AC35GHI5_9BILA
MDKHNKSSSGGSGSSKEQDFRSYKAPSRDDRRTIVRRRHNMQYNIPSGHHHQSRRSQTNSDAYSVRREDGHDLETRRLEKIKEKEGEKNQPLKTSQSQPPLKIPAVQDKPTPKVSTIRNDSSQISVANLEAPQIPTDIRKARSSVRRLQQATASKNSAANPQQRPSEQRRLQQASTNSSSNQQQQQPSEQQPSSSSSNKNSSTIPAKKPFIRVQSPNEYPDVIMVSSPPKQPNTNAVKRPAPPSDRLPIRSFAEIKKMSNEFGSLLKYRGKSENKYFKSFKYPHSPPPWKLKDLLPEPPNDDGYDCFESIPLPSGEGPCGITSTQQNIALDIHCINTTLKSLDPNERLKSLKLFIDEKTKCTIFFYLHAKEFAHGNESILARVALQRFVMVLNNALQLYEISTIPEKLFGKNESDSGKEWYIPLKNEYGYDTPNYVEFDRAGTSKKMVEIYTEFTKAETNILLDAYMLIQHSKELILEIQEKYINDHAGKTYF